MSATASCVHAVLTWTNFSSSYRRSAMLSSATTATPPPRRGDLISTPTRAPRSQQDWAQLALRETRLRNGTAVDQVGSMHTRHPRSTSLASSLAPHRHHKNRHKHVKESFHCQRKHKLPAHRCHHACSQASRPRSSLSHWQQTQKSGAIGPSSPIFLAFSA
jgi:hypothetical protein